MKFYIVTKIYRLNVSFVARLFFVRLVCICQIGANKETIPLIKETNNPTEVKKMFP